ncbi:hypothetical protein PILCRDRAFT_823601, partial [Piloderma croceum F 1598]
MATQLGAFANSPKASIMAEFEHGPSTKVDLNSLVKAASESLKAFEPWNHA